MAKKRNPTDFMSYIDTDSGLGNSDYGSGGMGGFDPFDGGRDGMTQDEVAERNEYSGIGFETKDEGFNFNEDETGGYFGGMENQGDDFSNFFGNSNHENESNMFVKADTGLQRPPMKKPIKQNVRPIPLGQQPPNNPELYVNPNARKRIY